MRPACGGELTNGVEHDYVVLYPSGQRFALRGVFVALVLGGKTHAGVRIGTRLFLVDPRAVVVRDGLIIRDPHSHPPTCSEMRAWLDAHPEWLRVATEILSGEGRA